MMLENKVAIVTGGARDIGKAVSKKLAKEGANVVINYYDNEDMARQTQEEIESDCGYATIVQGDMTKSEDAIKVVKHAQNVYGERIDILVNVAGGLVARKGIEEMEEDFLNSLMSLNFNSVFLMTKAVVNYMTDGGSIINFASQAARDGGGPGASAYASAKGAVMTFTRAMAKELGPRNIRVNAICPGMIATTFHDVFTNDAVREKVANGTPLRREGNADEVANLVAFLASNGGSFMTGTNIDINGGLAFS